ncbi:DUF4268 domain-containing protein [archaeon]|jgi:hypothetical protein|nr:DUF4268 domain-containing protein [archaeon]MBT6606530.1 DUF4268 domain-containing protein [archaeon]
MSTEIKLWQIEGEKLSLSETTMVKTGRKEVNDLEKWIRSNPEILGSDILLIGEQVMTKRGPLDFLGIDRSGNLVIVELKRDKLHREVLAQAVDYASDVASWDVDKLNLECEKYNKKNIDDTLREGFGLNDESLDEISVNKFQKILMVGTGVDESLQRMIEWLSDNYDVSINVLILKYTKTSGGDEILARTTIISEEVEQEKSQRQRGKIYAERHIVRKEFWTQFLEEINKLNSLFGSVNPRIDNWIGTSLGMSGVSINIVISKKYARSEIYINRGTQEENKRIFDILFNEKEKIESNFGSELTWEKMEENVTSRIKNQLDGVDVSNKEDWNKMNSFLIDSIVRMDKAFRMQISKINRT